MATTTLQSPFKTSPVASGRLSLLSSDVEDDLGLIDFEDPQFNFISRDEFWLLTDDEYDPKVHSTDITLEWLEEFSTKDVSDFFTVSNGYNTSGQTNTYNRFDYLTKSISRTATITKRKAESNYDCGAVAMPVASKFGTITKGTIYANGKSNHSPNRTYELSTRESLSGSISKISSSADGGDHMPTIGRIGGVNTNTITKNRRSFLLRTKCGESSESDYPSSNGVRMNSTFDLEESSLSDEITNNNDLKPMLNNTFTKDTDDTSCMQSTRNYPTISRNITRTLLRREASQGSLNYTGSGINPPQKYTSSNDDLLSSDSSTMSTRSNLSMTSSMSGRSEPNLHNSLAVHQIPVNGQTAARKFRPTVPVGKPQVQSRLARPSSQNGAVARKIASNASKLPNSSANSFGSMNSLQSNNMARNSSQISDIGGDEDEEQIVDDEIHNSSKLINGLGRKSTFRVHRPAPIVSVASVFGEHGGNQSGDDKNGEEMDDFRNKVFNSNSHLRKMQQVEPANRADSPSSNSSSCSSNSSISKIPNISLNRISNVKSLRKNGTTHHHYQQYDNYYNNNVTTFPLITNNNFYNNCKRDTNPLATKSSRIPAASLSKHSTTASNRSSIPVSGIAQPRSNIPHHNDPGVASTLARKSKLTSTFHQTSIVNRLPSHHQQTNSSNIYNNNAAFDHDNSYRHTNVVGDNSWQNDCF